MKEIQLTQGQVSKVDDDKFGGLSANLWSARWSKQTRSFYALRNEQLPSGKRRLVLMHREIMGALSNQDVDHINHDTLDNRRKNLRLVEQRNNSANSRKARGKRSPFKGVSWHRQLSRWQAHISDGPIRPDGRRKFRRIGLYLTQEEAAAAYDREARKSFGEYACLNFPGPGEQAARAEREEIKPTPGPPSCPRKRAGVSSRFIGVFWLKHCGKWAVDIRIRTEGKLKKKRIGLFSSEEAAATARDNAVRALCGLEAVFNFPQPGERSALPQECSVAAE